jgi:uncharacterized hydrophobic protein (TIGR00271 family)
MSVDRADIERMRSQLFFEGESQRTKLSRFWLLLPLSAVIAAAGVVGDSTATVIGAMIVAPLMTPILGIALATALADRTNLLRSIGLVILGAVAVIAIGYLVGLVTPIPIVAADNTQVASRVSPRLVDLLAAIATGAVGSVALCRSDISDTLPGVAIAISLVPPLTVVGLTLQSGEPSESLGALLLFVTNVSAILAMGTVVMAVFQVPTHGADQSGRTRPRVAQVIVAMVVVVAIPLALTSVRVTRTERREAEVRSVATEWADAAGWELVQVSTRGDGMLVRVSGSEPAPDAADLRAALDANGLASVGVEVELVPSATEHI